MIGIVLIGLAAIAAGAQIDPGGADAGVNAVIAVDQFVVINNTNESLTCATKSGRAWGSWFSIAAGAEWNETDYFASNLQFQCRQPVRGRIYPIASGKRYSLLRSNDSSVDLVEVTAAPCARLLGARCD